MADPPSVPPEAMAGSSPVVTSADEWEAAQDSPEFGRLRHALRSFVFPTTIAFLVWYFAYVLCAAFARDFMNIQVFGNVTVGLLFGVLQFVSTFLIALFYARHADSRIDPLADRLRGEIEGGQLAGASSRAAAGGAMRDGGSR
jgi:uncharacterized membrane protein (DUF485 family)